MPTMPGREESALATAGLLAGVGITTEIFVQPAEAVVGGPGNNENARRCLKWGTDNIDEPGLLFVEDDLIIKPERFKRAMASAEELGELMYFYMHDARPRTDMYPKEGWIERMMGPATRRGKPFSSDLSEFTIREGARLMRPGVRMYGTQCVYLPMAVARGLYDYMNQGYHYSATVKTSKNAPVDTALIGYYSEKGLPVYCYLPHPVQHLQNRTRRGAKRSDVYSKSFDLVSDLED